MGISIFFLGTLLGGLSPHFATLLVARIIQALGAGIMMPLMMTTIWMFSNHMNAVNIWGYLVW
ncbi:transport system protein [Staphylococcus aureus]|nr:transport system protein [Staphylococcus aureus]